MLFLAQVSRQLQQFLEQFLDVPAAGVVALNQFLEFLGEVGAGLVQANQLFELGTDGSFEDFEVSVLVFGFLELRGERAEINLRQVHHRGGLRGHVHACDGSIEQLADVAHDGGDVRRVGIELGADGIRDGGEGGNTTGKLQRRRVGLHRAVESADDALMAEELAAQRVRGDERVHGIGEFLQALHTPGGELLDGGENHLARGTERGRGVHSFAQIRDELLLVLHRVLAVLAGAINGQRLFQGGEHVGVVHDHAAVLAGEHAIRSGDGLHERVIPHRLVQIHRGTTRRVEAGQPHGADEHNPQRVGRVLEFLGQWRLRLVHPLAMRHDVQPARLHLLNLVLPR